MLAMLAITCLQIVLAIAKSSLVRSDEIHVEKRDADVQKRPHQSLLAVQHAMATEVLPDGRTVGMQTNSPTGEANTRQHIEHELPAENNSLMWNHGQAQEAVAELKVSAIEAPIGGETKTYMIRRQRRHPSRKKYAITNDAGDVEFADATLGTYAELSDPMPALAEQAPAVAQTVATVAPTAPITPATAAPVLAGTSAPAGQTTPAPVTADSSGSWLGSTIVNLFIFALVVVIVTIVSTICYGGIAEFLRRRNQSQPTDRLNASLTNDEEHETFRSRQRASARFAGRSSGRHFPTSLSSSRSRAGTSGETDLHVSKGSSSAKDGVQSLSLQGLVASGDEGTASTLLGTASVTASEPLYKYRHKHNRASTLQGSQVPAIVSTNETGEESPGGAGSYKSRHKTNRASTLTSKLNLPDHSAKKPAMEDIEEHEF